MRTVLKALFGLLLIGLLLWRTDLHALGHTLASYSWPWLLIALFLMVVSWPVAAARWKLFVPRVPFSRLLELTLIGQFYAIVLPGQLAGELVKAYRLAKGNIDAERLAASVVVDRIIGTIALLSIASTGLLLSRHHVPSAWAWLFLIATLVLIGSLFALRLPWAARLASHIIKRLEVTRLRGVAISLHRAMDAWSGFSRETTRLFASLALGIAFQLLGMAIFAALATNLGILLPLADWAWILGVVSLAVLIPVSIGGIGLREGALVGCLSLFGVAAERAIALSFGVFAITLVGALVGGLLEATGIRTNVATQAAKPHKSA